MILWVNEDYCLRINSFTKNFFQNGTVLVAVEHFTSWDKDYFRIIWPNEHKDYYVNTRVHPISKLEWIKIK